MSKIIQLNAENVKVLKAIEIKPERNVVELTGKNGQGQGKSSVIDSIIMGILGKKYQPEKPVREGESEANISINIGNLIIKRKIKADGSLLDEDNMKIITDMAEEKDYQVWIEKVDSSGKIGIVIEDGEIKAINKGE